MGKAIGGSLPLAVGVALSALKEESSGVTGSSPQR